MRRDDNRDLQTSVHGLRNAPVCERLGVPALKKRKSLQSVGRVVCLSQNQDPPLPVAVCHT